MWNLWSSMTLLLVNWHGRCLIFSMLDWLCLACQEYVYSYTGFFPWMLLQLQQTDTTGPSWEFSGHMGYRPDQNTAWNLELMAIQRLYKERSFQCNSSSVLISLLLISERAIMRNQLGVLLIFTVFSGRCFLFSLPAPSLWLTPFPPLLGSFNMPLSRAKFFFKI